MSPVLVPNSQRFDEANSLSTHAYVSKPKPKKTAKLIASTWAG